jgi:hypothetical protein
VSCPGCGAENSAGAKFCARCGVALAAACPRCAHLNAPDAGFCVEAGQLAAACLAEARKSESKRNVVKALRLQADGLLAEGAAADAAAAAAALDVAREVGNPAQIWKTLRTLGSAREDGAAELSEAIATIEEMAAGLSDPELARTLLASEELSDLRRRCQS